MGDFLHGHGIPGSVQLDPAAAIGNKPLDAQNVPVLCIVQKQLCGGFDLLDRAARLEEIQRSKCLMFVEMQLDIARLPPAAAVNAGKIGVGQRGPVFAQHIFAKATGAVAAFQRMVQVIHHGGTLPCPGLLHPAHDHQPGAGGLRRQQVIRLGRKLALELRVYDSNDAA